MASSSNAATLSSCTTPAVFEQDLPTPGPQPNRVHFSIYVDTRDIVLTRGNPSFDSLSGLIRVPMFTFRSQDTLRQFRVDDVKQKLSDYIWQHVHLDIRTSDFVILCNPSLATRHRWTPGLLKLNYTSFEYSHAFVGNLHYIPVAMDARSSTLFDTKIDPPRLYPRTVRIREQ